MNDINNMNDNYLYLINQKEFKNRFKIISEIKIHDDKLVLLTYDNTTKNICISKIKFEKKDDLSVYEKIKNNPHPNIENVLEIIEYDDYNQILIKYIDGENLFKISMSQCVNNSFLNKIYNDILSGMKHLEKLNIVHGDLRLENIMFAHGCAIIIDFEYAKNVANSQYSIIKYYCDGNSFGTINYVSPEGHELNIYSHKSDIWSIGIIFYKMITKKFPYDLENIIGDVRKCFKKINLNYLDKYKFDVINNVKKMLVFVDKKRSLE